jgi:hypothetical protein
MPKGINALIQEGNFKYVYNLFDESLARFWNPARGTEVRGEFALFTMSASIYSENDVKLYLARIGKGHLVPATAYELVDFASPRGGVRWNGRRTVMALGSKAGRVAVPLLHCANGGDRVLTMDGPDPSGYWRNDRSILCVKV